MKPPVLARDDFTAWSEAYLDSDPAARSRSPPAVKTPTGPLVEILRAWHGELAWEPRDVQAPVAIIRGDWDGLVTDQDARWLFERLARSAERRDIKIGRGTHLMHLEVMRTALWRESIAFLLGDDFKTQRTTTKGEHPMQDHHEAKDLPGYNPGSPEVAKSPITLEELNDLKATCLFTDEDMIYLRLSYDVLKDQAEDLVTCGVASSRSMSTSPAMAWIGRRANRTRNTPRLSASVTPSGCSIPREPNTTKHGSIISMRSVYATIGKKKNVTDHANAATHIRGRDLIGFAAATVAPMRPYLEKGGHSAETVQRMQDAWWKSMILQVTLWSQAYMNPGTSDAQQPLDRPGRSRGRPCTRSAFVTPSIPID